MDERKEQIAQEAGIATDDLITISEDKVLRMMERGVLVQLHIRHWRPFTQLRAADLGLREVKGKDYIQLGRKKLLPPDMIAKISTIEMRARSTLRDNSLPCFWGNFIPITAWPRWREQSDKIRKRFYEVRDEVVEGLPTSKTRLRWTYEEVAKDAYKRQQLDADAEAPEDFIERFVEACLSRIPPPEEIRASFRYEEVYNYIPLPSQIREHLSGLVEDNMRRQVAEQMFQQKEEMVNGFISEVSTGLRGMVVKVAQSVKEGIEKNDGQLIPRFASDLKNLVTRLERLNFYDDAEVQRVIEEIRREVDKPSKERNIPSIQKVLDNILSVSQKQIEDITSRTASRFEVIDLE